MMAGRQRAPSVSGGLVPVGFAVATQPRYDGNGSPPENPAMTVRLSWAALVGLLVASPAAAQLDPEPKTPYLWRVVLQAEPHPFLSGPFRDRLRRDIVAALQPALGPFGSVEIVDLAEVPRDRWDPLWQQFEDKGFEALTAPRDLTGVKTHFLRVTYRDGQYYLQARQHDGFTGLASPLVRTQAVRAAELVGRIAGLLLDRDFGVCGTVEPVVGRTDEVRVVVRGGRLGPLDRLVQPGDVLAVAQILRTNRPAPPPARTATGRVIAPPPGTTPPPALASVPRAFTLLRVLAVNPDATLRCAVFTQYQNPVPVGGNVVGYRCLKLGTTTARLAVRLAGRDAAPTSVGLVSVQASDRGFAVQPQTLEYDEKAGLFRSPKPLAHLACVTVTLGARQKPFAVPVLGPEPVVLPFEVNPKLEEEAAYLRAVAGLAARTADARNAQAICFDATARLIERQKNAEALARARGGFQAADAADKTLSDELARLQEYADKPADAARILAAVQQQLAVLRQHNAQLAAHIKTLEAVVARENDPAVAARDIQAEALNERIKLLLARGELDEAITAYGQLIALFPDDAELKARRDRLLAARQPQSPAHEKAREYLLKTWPAIATIPDFVDSLRPLTAAVDECIRAGDRYTLRKLLTVFTAAGVKLNELVDALDPTSEADRKLFEQARAVGEALAALEARVVEAAAKE